MQELEFVIRIFIILFYSLQFRGVQESISYISSLIKGSCYSWSLEIFSSDSLTGWLAVWLSGNRLIRLVGFAVNSFFVRVEAVTAEVEREDD